MKCLTISYKGSVRQLRSPVEVAPYFLVDGSKNENHPHPEGMRYEAVWDTGATATCVSSSVAKDQGFQKIGEQTIQTPAGQCQKNIYSVNVYLPNRVMFENLQVIEAELSGFDLLIGMDIISRGDFVVSNFENKSRFSFRLPSLHSYDFTKSKYLSLSKDMGNVGRNALCPCGSGKKYKNCCGK